MNGCERLRGIPFARRLLVMSLLLAEAGCAHHTGPSANATGREHTSATHTAARPAADLSPEERLDLAVQLLQKGEAGHAKAELKAYLEDVPDSRPARTLLAEIETPLSDLFPKQNFSVTLGTSDTLSGLAATYLGDPLAFYGLARYNNITEPGKIIAGQEIRIPATANALAVQNGGGDGKAAPVEADQPAANFPPAAAAPPASAPETAKITPAGSWALFKTALSRRQYSEAARLADDGSLDPGNDHAAVLADAYLRAALSEEKTDVASAGAHARKAGEIYLGALKQPEKARLSFQLALLLAASDAASSEGLKQANAQLAEKYYRRGIVAFQHQDLDGAIAAWNAVLSIDPDYPDARLNRAQAVQLKANLEKLKG